MTYIPPHDGRMSRADRYMVFAYTPFCLAALAYAFHLPHGDGTWRSLLPMATIVGAVVLATAIGIAMMTHESILRGDKRRGRRRA